jgi:hypothetical protein
VILLIRCNIIVLDVILFIRLSDLNTQTAYQFFFFHPPTHPFYSFIFLVINTLSYSFESATCYSLRWCVEVEVRLNLSVKTLSQQRTVLHSTVLHCAALHSCTPCSTVSYTVQYSTVMNCTTIKLCHDVRLFSVTLNFTLFLPAIHRAGGRSVSTGNH